MTQLFDLSGRTALVTGSARGIGFALAEGLATAGASVMLNGTRADTVADAVSRLDAKGFSAQGRAFDVTDEQAVADAFAQWDKDGIRIAIVINNARSQCPKAARRARTVGLAARDRHEPDQCLHRIEAGGEANDRARHGRQDR